MSQHDMVVANQGYAALRADMNAALQALASTSKGNSAPTTAYAGQLWLDDNTPSSTVWTVFQYDGSDWVAIGYLDTTNNLFIPKHPAGGVIQSVTASYATYSNTTTQIPTDDTIPQNTEGTEILSVSITPKFATSKLRIRAGGLFLLSGAGAGVLAVFRDSTADAVYAQAMNTPGTEYIALSGEAVIDASAATSTTLKVRVGPNAGVTMYVNGSAGSRIFGGVGAWRLTVEELAA